MQITVRCDSKHSAREENVKVVTSNSDWLKLAHILINSCPYFLFSLQSIKEWGVSQDFCTLYMQQQW